MPMRELERKFNNYVEWSDKLRQYNGWHPDTRCDGLLFNCLSNCATGRKADISLAQGKPGQWFRSPGHDCFVNGRSNGSKSTISRDMLVGLVHWIWQTRNSDWAGDLVKYGRKNSPWYTPAWKMGEGEWTRIWVYGGFQATILELRYQLSRIDSRMRHQPQLFLLQHDYPGHLTVLQMYLRWKMGKSVNGRLLQDYANQSWCGLNALYKAIAWKVVSNTNPGNSLAEQHRELALHILLTDPRFPNDRLPTNRDRRGFYLFQWDVTHKDWQPQLDGPEITHSGIDFLVAAGVLLGKW